ncbi:MAG: hypothetical protein ACYDES_04505 [Acidimicrobiales bacterium]
MIRSSSLRRVWAVVQAVLIISSTMFTVSLVSIATSAGSAGPAAAAAPTCITSPTDFANALLAAIPAPDTASNIEAILAWEQMEGGNWYNTAKFNPLDTTLVYDNSQLYEPNPPAPVQAYNNWNDGVEATLITLTQTTIGGVNPYDAILAALAQGNNPQAVAQAIDNSVWGTTGVTGDLPPYAPAPNYDPPSPPWQPACSVNTSGQAWVTVAGGSDFCRPVGAGPDNVASYLACTPYNGSTFGTTITSGITDWGYNTDRAWVNVNGAVDYCRQVGLGPNNVASAVECTPFNGTSFGATVLSGVLDWGYPTGAAWVSVYGGVEYCRRVGTGPNNVASALACTPFNGTSFGSTSLSGIVDWGYPTAADWVNVNGAVDYCRQVGLGPNNVASALECTSFNLLSFGSTVLSGIVDWGYPTGAAWVSVSGGADYCRRVGAGPDNIASALECTSFNGTSFGSTSLSGIVDWGYPTGQNWVSLAGNATYCRQVGGGPNLVSSYLECTTFAGGDPSTYASGLADWGYGSGAGWAQGPGGVDYCAWQSPAILNCTSFSGQQFGYTQVSGPQPWGYGS